MTWGWDSNLQSQSYSWEGIETLRVGFFPCQVSLYQLQWRQNPNFSRVFSPQANLFKVHYYRDYNPNYNWMRCPPCGDVHVCYFIPLSRRVVKHQPKDRSLKPSDLTSKRLSQPNTVMNHTHIIHGTGTFTYVWLIFMVNVGKYTIHTFVGHESCSFKMTLVLPQMDVTQGLFKDHWWFQTRSRLEEPWIYFCYARFFRMTLLGFTWPFQGLLVTSIWVINPGHFQEPGIQIILVVVSNMFYIFHPEPWGRFPFWLIFFKVYTPQKRSLS